MKKNIRFLSLMLVMVLMITCLAACGGNSEGPGSEGTEAAGATVILVDQDGTEYTYSLEAGKNLRDALHDAGLIDDENYTNMFVETIDGHTALMEDGVLWMMADENKEQIMGFFEEHVLAEGETMYLLYTVAPNFDD